MPDLYSPIDFENVGKDLGKLEREEFTAYELISQFYDEIQATEQRGVPLQRIYEVLEQKQLKIKFSTFRSYLTHIKAEKQKEARRLKRQKKRTFSNAPAADKVTTLLQRRKRNQDVKSEV